MSRLSQPMIGTLYSSPQSVRASFGCIVDNHFNVKASHDRKLVGTGLADWVKNAWKFYVSGAINV